MIDEDGLAGLEGDTASHFSIRTDWCIFARDAIKSFNPHLPVTRLRRQCCHQIPARCHIHAPTAWFRKPEGPSQIHVLAGHHAGILAWNISTAVRCKGLVNTNTDVFLLIKGRKKFVENYSNSKDTFVNCSLRN